MLKMARSVWLIITCTICGLLTNGVIGLLPHKGGNPITDGLERPQADANVVQFFRLSETERAVRSTPSCEKSQENITSHVTVGDDVTVNCPCTRGTLTWYDENCVLLTSQDTHVTISNGTLKISSYGADDPREVECRNSDVTNATTCYYRVLLSSSEPVPHGGAMTGLVVCIILAVVLVIFLCCVRRFKTRISLCMRDTFKANSGNDGKIYDAYVSTAVSEIDGKFVQRFVNDTLRRNYGYSVLVDDSNLLPRLEYSDKVQANLYKCRRLIVIFSPSYMTHDWCMYCFNEGLRKLIDLQVPMIFVITDHSMLTELRAHADLIAHVPQILYTAHQKAHERQHAIDRVRQQMPPPIRSVSFRKRDGMRSPMLSDAESIHKSDINFNSNGTAHGNGAQNETEYRFGSSPENPTEIAMEYDEEIPQEPDGPDDFVNAVQTGEEIDPNSVRVNQYDPRKDFLHLTMSDDEM